MWSRVASTTASWYGCFVGGVGFWWWKWYLEADDDELRFGHDHE